MSQACPWWPLEVGQWLRVTSTTSDYYDAMVRIDGIIVPEHDEAFVVGPSYTYQQGCYKEGQLIHMTVFKDIRCGYTYRVVDEEEVALFILSHLGGVNEVKS